MSQGDFGTPVQFFWELHPALVGFIVFAIDFGAIMVIRVFVERKFYLMRWWSFKVGDTIALPVYAGSAAVVIADADFSGWYTHWIWHAAIFAVGYLIFVGLHIHNWRSGFFSKSDALNPSEMYHTLIAGVMFYLMASVLIPAFVADDNHPFAGFLVGGGLALYIGSWFIDQTSLVDKTPGRLLATELVINIK